MADQTPHDLTRLTVNLTPKARAALTWAAALTGDTQTDVVNRALQVYALIHDPDADGGSLLIDDLTVTIRKTTTRRKR